MNLTWIVPRELAAMSRPHAGDLARLRELGITALVSLTETAPDGVAGAGLEGRHLPVEDFAAPTQAQLAEAVAFVDAVIARGGAVAVHCGAGLGRTGTVIAAWLASHGRTPDEAIRDVRRKRPGSVETDEQEQAVREFAKSAAHGGAASRAASKPHVRRPPNPHAGGSGPAPRRRDR